ncbi:MAG: TIGR01777 family oxidoreductase [Desulfomonile sp.]|nr:TIGR01777 family oxidoreductase [Desulfomonile sp.]
MKAFITGGTGFVGTKLTRALLDKGHEVTVLSRSEKRRPGLPAQIRLIAGDPTEHGLWQQEVPEHDVLINLAGESIFSRWNDEYKKRLRDSRILTTRNLVEAIPSDGGAVKHLLSTSAVGYYGFTGDEELGEDADPGTDFLATLAQDWEAEALKAAGKGIRVVVARFGVVLGKDGGALEQMVRPFRLFAGGPIGSGKQWFSWIHVEDLCRAALFVIEHPEISGPVNFCAPNPVRNADLADAIGNTLHRPSFIPAPGFVIKLVMGEFGSVILKGQRVVPKMLKKHGFHFNYGRIEDALNNLLSDT